MMLFCLQSAVAWVQLFLSSSLLNGRDDPPGAMQKLLMAAIAPATAPPSQPQGRPDLTIRPLDLNGSRKGPVNEGWDKMVHPNVTDLSKKLLVGSQMMASLTGGAGVLTGGVGVLGASIPVVARAQVMPFAAPVVAAPLPPQGGGKRRKIGQGNHRFDCVATMPPQAHQPIPVWPWQG